MKNYLISISLFIIMVILLFYADHSFKSLCNDIIIACDAMEETARSGDLDELFQPSMDLFNMIQSNSTIAAIYINHMDYDIVLNEALKLNVYVEQGDPSEASASLHLLKYMAYQLKHILIPTFRNIF